MTLTGSTLSWTRVERCFSQRLTCWSSRKSCTGRHLSGVVFHEGVLADDLTSTDLLELALGGKGSSKPVMVGGTGLEPVTCRL